ncbi:MAG: hypothetical protein ACRETL_05025, partial [Gammaproteobacteria bacterium]
MPAFGRPGARRGESACPRIRFASLAEIGIHVLFGARMAGCTTRETALSKMVLPSLEKVCYVWRGAGCGHGRGSAVAREKEHASG